MNTSIIEQMDDLPQPVTYESHGDWTTVLLRTNIEAHTEGEGEATRTYYTDVLTRIALENEELTPELKEAIEAAPEKFVNYIPRRKRAAVQKQYTDAIQKWMNDTAHERGYDDIFTAISYTASDVPKFQAEALACKTWRDKVWVACYDYLDKVLAGETQLLPLPEFIATLPQIEW